MNGQTASCDNVIRVILNFSSGPDTHTQADRNEEGDKQDYQPSLIVTFKYHLILPLFIKVVPEYDR